LVYLAQIWGDSNEKGLVTDCIQKLLTAIEKSDTRDNLQKISDFGANEKITKIQKLKATMKIVILIPTNKWDLVSKPLTLVSTFLTMIKILRLFVS
jgi:hypothetical protein